MAERENRRLGVLGAENSTEDSVESMSGPEAESDTEDERVPQLRERQVGELRGSGCGVEANGNELKTLGAIKSTEEEQDVMSREEVLAGTTCQALKPQANDQLGACVCPTSSELSPTSAAQSMPSVSRIRNLCSAEADLRNTSSQKPALTLAAVKSSGGDGYNWRKYGQKQVKSPQGSRSYFRCTHAACGAKKIEFCDQSGHVKETIYKNQHNHDPPRKGNNVRQNRMLKSSGPIIENNASEHSTRILNGSDPSTSSRESVRDTSIPSEGRPQVSSSFGGDAETTTGKAVAPESEQKHRGKKNSLSSPVLKPGKKPKFVVHAAGDVGISGDGYRWRKYGQKMVKGNPHPRNYYRCTSAGCQVRKHIEIAVDNASAVIITYKGIHDHDMPVPKKRHGLPSAPLVGATTPASLSSAQGKKPHQSQTQESPTQWSVGTEGDLTGEALELGGEKAMESARTLLSIGFEIKPC